MSAGEQVSFYKSFSLPKPLPEKVADVIRREIVFKAKPDDRLPSEKELAARFAVSLVTVREALRSLAQAGLVRRRHGSGTYVTAHAAQRHIAIVSLLSDGVRGLDFQMRLLRLLSAEFQQRGYSSRLYLQPDTASEAEWSGFLTEIAQGRICGAAFVAMNPDSFAAALHEAGVPHVVTSEAGVHGVQVDYVGIVREGARCLLEQGCRRLALLQGMALPGEQVLADRSLAAFHAVLQEHGASSQPRWIRQAIPPNTDGAGWEQFREVWGADPIKPDGLVVTDDVLFRDVALGIYDSRISVPDQLRVVTHANKGSGLTYPFPVDVLEIDPQECAAALAAMLVRLLRQEPVSPRIEYVSARLVRAPRRVEQSAVPCASESAGR